MEHPAVLNDLSLVPVRVTAMFGESVVGHATAFVYAYAGSNYLITNWHVVTGRHPDTELPIDSKTCALPDHLIVEVPFRRVEQERPIAHLWWESWGGDLYSDVERNAATWYQHPTHGRKIDVVALPMEFQKEHIALRPANDASLNLNEAVLYPSLSVYVLGYPLGLAGGLNFPIWKRGTIASEPEFPLDGLPKIYIDTATRKGMSGAPVYVDEPGSWLKQNPDGSRVWQLAGRGRKLVGVYASRDGGGTEFDAQLGVVWKAEVIDEIIVARCIGTSSFGLA